MLKNADTTITLEKRWRIVETNEKIVRQLQEQLGIHPLFCQLLAQRGMWTARLRLLGCIVFWKNITKTWIITFPTDTKKAMVFRWKVFGMHTNKKWA